MNPDSRSQALVAAEELKKIAEKSIASLETFKTLQATQSMWNDKHEAQLVSLTETLETMLDKERAITRMHRLKKDELGGRLTAKGIEHALGKLAEQVDSLLTSTEQADAMIARFTLIKRGAATSSKDHEYEPAQKKGKRG